jgi:hypothetical protein
MKLDRTLEIIYNKLDPWSFENPDKTKDQLFAEILSDIKTKQSFPIEKDGMVFYVMPETDQRARLHLFSETRNVKTSIESAKWLTNFLFCHINSLEKLYGITPHKKFIRVINKFHWKHEGTLTHSHLSKSGKMKDQYVFGVTKHEFLLQQSNNAHKQN